MEEILVFCKNTNSYHSVKPGTKLVDFMKEVKCESTTVTDANGNKYNMPTLAAYIDNQLKELSFGIYMPHSIEFLNFSNPDGRRCYMRSLFFVLQKAVSELYPKNQLIINYSLPNGSYAEITATPTSERPSDSIENRVNNVIEICEEEVFAIKKKMQEIIDADFPIVKKKFCNDDAVKLFLSHNQYDKARLCEDLARFFVSVYFIDNYGDTFYGPQLHSTGYLNSFDLKKYNKGFYLQMPDGNAPFSMPNVKYQEKLFEVFKENANWCKILGAQDIATINKAITLGYGSDLIQIAEALHERKYAAIADQIYKRRHNVKLVLFAWPSSSGKTTTSKRLSLQLKVLGLNPVVIEMDNYFVNRENTPRDANGNYDFECLGAMDLKFLNTQLTQLFNGEEIELPKFDFAKGARFFDGTKIRLQENDILIMEGIHALNPQLTSSIEREKKFLVYASALTSLSIDENNYISTSDNRLLRRMVRDNNFRGTTAEQTISRWASVRRGEYNNIFPYQENADAMFNSSLLYELPLLKHYAEPLLRKISPKSPVYAESLRLLKFLSYTVELSHQEQEAIPPTSVLREFIGNSSFKY
ncbi:MAG: nucleoside kinase [Bacteroidia bacterium]|nr:nucleoside kinase [Bacteroidia bacterium]